MWLQEVQHATTRGYKLGVVKASILIYSGPLHTDVTISIISLENDASPTENQRMGASKWCPSDVTHCVVSPGDGHCGSRVIAISPRAARHTLQASPLSRYSGTL